MVSVEAGPVANNNKMSGFVVFCGQVLWFLVLMK